MNELGQSIIIGVLSSPKLTHDHIRQAPYHFVTSFLKAARETGGDMLFKLIDLSAKGVVSVHNHIDRAELKFGVSDI